MKNKLKLAFLIPSFFFISLYLYVALSRLFYPFELEWIEGAVFDMSLRMTKGLPVYAPPSVELVPLMYSPFFYYFGAGLIKLFGINLWAIRLISLFSSILSGLLIFEIIRGRTKSVVWGLVGVGLFFGTFKITCFWFDIARVDSLFIMLILLSYYLIEKKRILLSILTFTLAFFSKQSALLFILAAAFYLIIKNRKKGFIFLIIFPLIYGITLLLNYATDGWYLYCTFTLPKYQPLLDTKLKLFFFTDLLKNMPIVVGYVIGWFIFWAVTRKRGNLFDEDLLLALFLISSFAVSLFGRGITGGAENSIIPFTTFSSILLSICFSKLETKPTIGIILGSIIVQSIIWAYNPLYQIPTKKDREAGERFLQYISQIKGDVLIPYHGFYLAKAGKEPCFHISGLSDLEFDKNKGKKLIDSFIIELKEGLEKRRWSLIVLNETGIESFDNFIRNYYYLAGTFLEEKEIGNFFTLTGWKRRPTYLYFPKEK